MSKKNKNKLETSNKKSISIFGKMISNNTVTLQIPLIITCVLETILIVYLLMHRFDDVVQAKSSSVFIVFFVTISYLVIMWLLVYLSKNIAVDINLSNKFSTIANSMHNHLTSVLRDGLVDVMKTDMMQNDDEFIRYQVRICTIFLRCLHECVMEFTNQNISLCIKLFNSDDKNNSRSEQNTYTFCRFDSKKGQELRRTQDYDADGKLILFDINKNAPLKHIMRGNDYFSCGDLDSYSKNNNFFTENEKWREFYVSTIVVPLYFSNSDSSKNYIIGFLGIDSKDKNMFWERKDNNVLKLAFVVADVISAFLTISDYLYNANKKIPN